MDNAGKGSFGKLSGLPHHVMQPQGNSGQQEINESPCQKEFIICGPSPELSKCNQNLTRSSKGFVRERQSQFFWIRTEWMIHFFPSFGSLAVKRRKKWFHMGFCCSLASCAGERFLLLSGFMCRRNCELFLQLVKSILSSVIQNRSPQFSSGN